MQIKASFLNISLLSFTFLMLGAFTTPAHAQFANESQFHGTVVNLLQDVDQGTARFPYGDFDTNEEPGALEWYMYAIGDEIVERQRPVQQNTQQQQQYSGYSHDPYYAAYANSFGPRTLDYFVAPQPLEDDYYTAYFNNYQENLANTQFYSYSDRLDAVADDTTEPPYVYDFVYEPPADLTL